MTSESVIERAAASSAVMRRLRHVFHDSYLGTHLRARHKALERAWRRLLAGSTASHDDRADEAAGLRRIYPMRYATDRASLEKVSTVENTRQAPSRMRLKNPEPAVPFGPCPSQSFKTDTVRPSIRVTDATSRALARACSLGRS